MKKDKNSIIRHFSEMKDFRMNRKRLYPLIEIITIAIAATLCGAESYEEIEDFGLERVAWLKTFLELSNGFPSHDTSNRVFALMDPEKFEMCFRSWVKAVLDSPNKGLICIDGKTIRGAKTGGIKSPIHMVSAWLSEENIVLGQVKVSEKSNEIIAIPELIKGLFIKDCIISVDAMGCRQDIAKCILAEGGDYVLAVKNNQPTLYQNIEDSFRFYKPIDFYESTDTGHGIIEKKCSIITDLSHIEQPEK
ncbi:MAG: ISAs1 family transposase [Sphingobacteriales bacterium]|nr:MAG: ISAs1 family transposase [Sphingobacteriales bacterium]